jgi:hypothetical protein
MIQRAVDIVRHDTGMAFVLITRLGSRRDSILPELLAKAAQMPVSEIEDGTPVALDHVYVMPRASLRFKGRGSGNAMTVFQNISCLPQSLSTALLQEHF